MFSKVTSEAGFAFTESIKSTALLSSSVSDRVTFDWLLPSLPVITTGCCLIVRAACGLVEGRPVAPESLPRTLSVKLSGFNLMLSNFSMMIDFKPTESRMVDLSSPPTLKTTLSVLRVILTRVGKCQLSKTMRIKPTTIVGRASRSQVVFIFDVVFIFNFILVYLALGRW